jgi:hypothetical protein
MEDLLRIADSFARDEIPVSAGDCRVYPRSRFTVGNSRILMVRSGKTGQLLAGGSGSLFDDLDGESLGQCKLCPLNESTRLALYRHLPFTVPEHAGRHRAGIGLGDRLGRAAAGHLKAVQGKDVFPILAQQSMRELSLTGRTYQEVLDAACFVVVREGYTGGYGADGDHLKKESDIAEAIRLGFSMITLDCSDFIDTTAESLTTQALKKRYALIPSSVRREYERAYGGASFRAGNAEISFDASELARCLVLYSGVIDYAEKIYTDHIRGAGRGVDFELSIDETSTPTTPEAHYLVAAELLRRGVEITSLAPRFCGEFQKGVDYRGSVDRFEREFAVHAAIADEFGYRLSVHSGSDKFAVFPAVGRLTEGRFHVKTAGTSWLEAVRLVARRNPELYRKVHAKAIASFSLAREYYHVSADPASVAPLDSVADGDLPGYLDDDDARQVLHITYGFILNGTAEGTVDSLGREFLAAIDEDEDLYRDMLAAHIGKHLALLGK